MGKRIVCLIMMMVFVSGCAGMSDSNRTKAEGTAVGAGTGAALGAIIGQIAGRDTKSTVIGAVIGAAIGTAAGHAYGSHAANKKTEFSNQEDYLNACIASAQQINFETQGYNATLTNEIGGLDQEINYLISQYNRKKINSSQLRNEKTKVENKLSEAQAKLQRARDETAIQKEVYQKERTGSSQKLNALNDEISNLERASYELESQIRALESINRRFVI